MLNKTNILKLFGIGSICLFLLGCSEESFLMQENLSDVRMETISGITLAKETSLTQDESEEKETHGSPNSSEVMQSDSGEGAESPSTQREIAVHICGAVNQPGVYYLMENQRLHEAIAKAGGFREDADEDYLNQALVLEDGMKIVVPTMEETAWERKTKETASEEGAERILSSAKAEKAALEDGYFQKNEENDEPSEQERKIDLNTADETLLCTLPGIGESRAKSIIAYRQENGMFRSPEDIMNVSGIKEAAYAKIKDYIMVSD